MRLPTGTGNGPRLIHAHRSALSFGLVYAAILLVLVAMSFPRETGDAGDYVAMAYNLSHGRPPALSEADLVRVRAYFDRWKTGYETYPQWLFTEGGRGGDGRYDTQHFWFYSAAVAPVLAVTDALGIHPNRAFTLVNLALLILAAAVVARRLHWLPTALLFLGPILWWVDKAQTEAFTFSLLAIAMACLRERPWWSFVCLGAAATENPPIAGALVIAIVITGIARPAWRRQRAFWTGAAVGLALAALYPLYYLIHLGKLSSFVGVRHQVPTLAELKVPIVDLNYGLAWGAPILTLAVLAIAVVVLVRDRGRVRAFDVLITLAIVPVFLVSFAQSPELASGGTPSISRYALWLIPLAIPLILWAQQSMRWSWLWLTLVASSVLWCLLFFNPERSESNSVKPSPVAAFVWRHWPGLDNPLAEIFHSRVAHRFGPLEPIATNSCSKELIVYGEWARCPVGRIPSRCVSAPCYANRSGHHYDFVDAPVPPGSVLPGPNAEDTSAPPAGSLFLAGHARTFTLLDRAIRPPAGDLLRIVPGRVTGSVESSEIVGDMAQFAGWAGSIVDRRPAGLILVFVNGAFVGGTGPTVSRPDVAQATNAPWLIKSGYSFKLPLHLVQSAERKFDVQIFAAESHVASLLAFTCASDLQQDFGC